MEDGGGVTFMRTLDRCCGVVAARCKLAAGRTFVLESSVSDELPEDDDDDAEEDNDDDDGEEGVASRVVNTCLDDVPSRSSSELDDEDEEEDSPEDTARVRVLRCLLRRGFADPDAVASLGGMTVMQAGYGGSELFAPNFKLDESEFRKKHHPYEYTDASQKISTRRQTERVNEVRDLLENLRVGCCARTQTRKVS